ncbi:MAG: LLM class flavin-dependent oxidoreductase [Actinomycetota bacterium]|nr:LLM class flavin-dependent oxidoreductase [Actinomycetota bacterium]
MKIRFAVATTNTPAALDEFTELVDGLESRGFDSMWLSDTPLTEGIEPLMALAVASARTTKLKLGTNVVVPGRNPMLLAKELAHLDRLSGGRLLLAFMPGIGSPIERAALGVVGVDRNQRLAKVIELCHAWWSGEPVTDRVAGFDYDGVRIGPAPVQAPLEIWLGGNGPKGLELTGTHGDGWLGSRATPAQAKTARQTIAAAAASVGRTIDEDHYGISIPYARTELDDASTTAVMRRTDATRSDILPIGADETRSLVQRHLDAGLSKFVLRPMSLADGWDAELDFLAEHIVPLQA